jgi:tetratricopeptide (TPR) repeat protein
MTATRGKSPRPSSILPAAAMQDARAQLENAELLRQQGKLDRAESACHTLTRRHPAYAAAWHTQGLVQLDKRNYERALDCLVRAVMLSPQSWMSLTALSRVYARLGATDMAAQTLERAIAVEPKNPAILVSLAEILRDEREYERAVEAYRQALRLDPSVDSAAIGLGLCLGAIGENTEAQAVFETLLQRGCRTLDLCHAMTTLPAAAMNSGILKALDNLPPGQDEDSKLVSLFVRGTALDAAGRHSDAWDCFRTANRTMAAACDNELRDHLAREQANLASLRGMAGRAAAPDERAPVSLFILGPSRSGKTSLERLFGALDGVKRGYENPAFDHSLRRTFHAAALPPGRHLEQLPAANLQTFRDQYQREIVRRAGDARVFTNSTPSRIHEAGLIASTIPNARFVVVKRNARDNALRIYMKKYLQGNSYAYNLQTIYDYLDWYDQMSAVLAAKFPGNVRQISYEAMVTDPVSALRETADLCGIALSHDALPAIGDDRGCAAPYRDLMQSTK